MDLFRAQGPLWLHTPDTWFRGDSTAARNSFEQRQHMSVYLQSCGTGLCLQTQGPVDSCSGVIALSRSKREDSTEQLCAHSRPHTIAGAAPLPSCGHTALFPPSCAPLPASPQHLPWLPGVTSPCRHLPAGPTGSSAFLGAARRTQVAGRAEPQERPQQTVAEDLGEVGKVLQRGKL